MAGAPARSINPIKVTKRGPLDRSLVWISGEVDVTRLPGRILLFPGIERRYDTYSLSNVMQHESDHQKRS